MQADNMLGKYLIPQLKKVTVFEYKNGFVKNLDDSFNSTYFSMT